MATTPQKATKAQIAEAKIRAAASGIKMDQSAKGLRNASKGITKGAAIATGAAGAAVAVARNAIKKTAPTRAVGTMKKLSDVTKLKAADKLAPKAGKATAKAKPVSPKTKPAMPKSKGPAVLMGEAAAEAVRKSTTPKGVKEFEKGASKALDKKYPGLYKNGKK